MTIEPGTKLGPYEVVAPIGAGGMGEVYKAKDTRLDRIVAVKVLPEHLAESPERKQRFEREAKAISQLNHPHICTLHDVGEQDGIDYLVMEYIEGETLADLLKSGALPLEKALEYGIQIADALDTAHRAAIVHRDLKPPNIIITKSGVKLLDFGLARIVADESVSDASDALTKQQNLTKDHTVVGTLHYMAPEQLEGKTIDTRADIFAFGAVLYEMVTGKKAFDGDTAASLITAIMSSEPRPVSELRAVAPAALDRVVKKCLAKDRDTRWQTALDLRDEIEWIHDGGGQEQPAATTTGARRYGALLATALVVGIGVWALSSRETIVDAPLRHFTVSLPSDVTLPFARGELITIAGDGSRIAFMGDRDGVEQLFVRSVDERDFGAIPGTEGARHPALSPDGERIAFDLLGRLYTADFAGGRVTPIADVGLYPSWGPDGYIYYWSAGLWRVPVNGGKPEELAALPEDNITGRPKVLPNGKAVLFEDIGARGGVNVELFSLETGETRPLVTGGGNPRYVSSGHILFTRAGEVFAIPFDADSLRVTGTELHVGRDIRVESGFAGQFAVTADGTLVHAERVSSDGKLARVDLDGNTSLLTERIEEFNAPRSSPDGSQIAFGMLHDIWSFDVARDVVSRLTFEGQSLQRIRPVWSPDGTEIAFAGSGGHVYRTSTGGTSEPSRITSTRLAAPIATSWSPDGNLIILETLRTETGRDLHILRVEDGTLSTFIDTLFNEKAAMFSPDGRFVTYESDESGRYEVFVVPFPEPTRKWQISTDGGREPRWSRSGDELFYRSGDAMMSVSVQTQDDFIPQKPRLLFEVPSAIGGTLPDYDVLADDEGFVMVQMETSEERGELHVILNWFEELKRLAPEDN